MQDPAETLRNLLQANWNDLNVSSRMVKANLEFITLPYSFDLPKVERRPIPDDRNGSVQIFRVTGDSKPLGLNQGVAEVDEVYQIDVFVKPASRSQTDIDNAKTDRWQVEREISRIIRANRTSMTDLKFGFPSRFIQREESDSYPPILTSSTEVEVKYFET